MPVATPVAVLAPVAVPVAVKVFCEVLGLIFIVLVIACCYCRMVPLPIDTIRGMYLHMFKLYHYFKGYLQDK
jgi:hypothetical protein